MIIRGITIYSLGELLFRVGKVVLIYLMAALLSEIDFGIYSYLISMSVMAIACFDFGLSQLALLRLKASNFSLMFPLLVAAKIAVAITSISFIALLLWLTDLLPGYKGAVLPAFLLFCIALDAQGFLGNALRARLAVAADAKIKVLGLTLLLLCLLGYYGVGFRLTAVSVITLQACATLIAIAYVTSGLDFRFVPSKKSNWLHMLRGAKAAVTYAAPIAVASFGAQMSSSVDSAILGASEFFLENASFTLAQRILFLFQLPMVLILGGAMPFIVQRMAGGARRPPTELVQVATMALLLAALSAHGLYLVTMQTLVPILFAGKYMDAIKFGQILVYAMVPIFVYPVFQALLCAKRHVFSTYMILLGATVTNAVLDIITIRVFGPNSVGWVVVAINWALLVAMTIHYARKMSFFPVALKDAGFVTVGAALLVGVEVIGQIEIAIATRIWMIGALLTAVLFCLYCFVRRRQLIALVADTT